MYCLLILQLHVVVTLLALLSSFSGVDSFSLRPNFGRQTKEPSHSITTPEQQKRTTTSHTLAAQVQDLAVAGRVGPVLSRLGKTPTEFGAIRQALSGVFSVGDVAILGAVGWLTIPAAKRFYAWRHESDYSIKAYENSWLGRWCTLISSFARATSFIYTGDILAVILSTIGFQLDARLMPAFTKTVYAIWGALRLRRFKKIVLKQITRKEIQGNVQVAEKVLDGVLGIWLFFFLNDIFHITMGKGVTSVLTVGGITGLAISLASKDLAGMLVAGFAVQFSRRFDIGDKIRLGDGTTGNIVDMGALETLIKGVL